MRKSYFRCNTHEHVRLDECRHRIHGPWNRKHWMDTPKALNAPINQIPFLVVMSDGFMIAINFGTTFVLDSVRTSDSNVAGVRLIPAESSSTEHFVWQLELRFNIKSRFDWPTDIITLHNYSNRGMPTNEWISLRAHHTFFRIFYSILSSPQIKPQSHMMHLRMQFYDLYYFFLFSQPFFSSSSSGPTNRIVRIRNGEFAVCVTFDAVDAVGRALLSFIHREREREIYLHFYVSIWCNFRAANIMILYNIY